MKNITKGVYQVPLMPFNSINCYLIEDILIDAGIRTSGAKILKALSGFEVNAHAITHAHADHQGASKEVCEKLKTVTDSSKVYSEVARRGFMPGRR